MAHRSLWLFAAALLVGIALLLGWRSCGREDAGDAGAPASNTADSGAATAPLQGKDAANVTGQRQQAVSAAASTLHRYLAALSSKEFAKADAFWLDGRPPAQSNEADLRSLKDLSALRIENDPPKPLDSEPVPAALEIPIELRASTGDAANRYYRGWYRLRVTNAAKGEWKITSASVKVETR